MEAPALHQTWERVRTLTPVQLRRAHPAPGLPLSPAVAQALDHRSRAIARATGDEELGRLHRKLMADTWTRTLQPGPDGIFVVTGDIPAMWLRDSSAQMRPWLALAAECQEIAEVIAGVVRMQWRLIAHDPYANAFNHGPTGGSYHLLDNHVVERRADPWIWERKYEVDSLAFPILLADQLWQATGRDEHLTWAVHKGFEEIVALWRREQHHDGSRYRFIRLGSRDTLPRGGRGAPVGFTGMTWQAFRPSDDACRFGYNIPANLMAAHVLGLGARMCEQLWHAGELAAEARALAEEIRAGVERHGSLPDGSWAYECDGLGALLVADDANLPSLLGLPLLAGIAADDPRYQATRRRICSSANPWWYQGSAASGIGSPHTGERRVWPIALAVEGLTSTDRDEKLRLARLLAHTTAGTSMMHESFDADDPARYTREWFSWANMMFCELVDQLADPHRPEGGDA